MCEGGRQAACVWAIHAYFSTATRKDQKRSPSPNAEDAPQVPGLAALRRRAPTPAPPARRRLGRDGLWRSVHDVSAHATGVLPIKNRRLTS